MRIMSTMRRNDYGVEYSIHIGRCLVWRRTVPFAPSYDARAHEAVAREQDKRAAEYLKKIPGARSIEVIDSPALRAEIGHAIQHGGALK